MGACIPLNIMFVTFLLQLGTAAEFFVAFAYISAIPALNLVIDFYVIYQAGYTNTPMNKCFVLQIILLWVGVVANAGLNSYMSYLVLAPLAPDQQTAEALMNGDAVFKM
jgi:formate hydrogenlyase subunit 3/multisubunit Na+/H+ antiporter MnhD subunit